MAPLRSELVSRKLTVLVRLERELKSAGRAARRKFSDSHECIQGHFLENCEESLRSYDEIIHEGDAAVSDEVRQGRRFHLP